MVDYLNRKKDKIVLPCDLNYLSTALNTSLYSCRKHTFKKRNCTLFLKMNKAFRRTCTEIRLSLTIGDGSLSPWNTDPWHLANGVLQAFGRRNWDMNKMQVKCFQVSKRTKRNDSCKGKEFNLQNKLRAWKCFSISLSKQLLIPCFVW